jgi:hypothetical protein
MEPAGSLPGHKRPPLVPILSHMNSVHTPTLYLRSILLLSSHVYLCLSSSPFPSRFLIKILYAFHISSMHSTCTTYLILLDFITLIFGEVSNYKAPYYTIPVSLLSLHPSQVQIFSSPPCSQTPTIYVRPFMWEPMFHTYTKQVSQL